MDEEEKNDEKSQSDKSSSTDSRISRFSKIFQKGPNQGDNGSQQNSDLFQKHKNNLKHDIHSNSNRDSSNEVMPRLRSRSRSNLPDHMLKIIRKIVQ